MRDHDERSAVVLQRFGERLAHLDVEVIGRLVEEQEVRARAHDQREREARLLAAREAPDGGLRHRAAEVEAAQVVAQLLLARRRIDACEVRER